MFKNILLIVLGMTIISSAYALDPNQQQEIVMAHNKWRQQVGVPEVQWSPNLASAAQSWADTLKQNLGCNPEHSNEPDVGQNLFWAGPLSYSDGASEVQAINSAQVADAWGNEKQDYIDSENTCANDKVCGHYTQIVWKSTKEVGCALAVCNDNSQIWVCDYAPAGNYRGKKPY